MRLFGSPKYPDWKKQLQTLGKSMLEVTSGLEGKGSIAQLARAVVARLDKDLEDLDRHARFVFAAPEDSEDFTEANIELLRRWHTGSAPSLAALCIMALEQLNLELAPDMKQAVLTASILGEVENSLPYHNNMHYKKVLLQLLRLLGVHNSIYMGTSRAFDDRKTALLLIAACIHDLGHDGKGNTLKGIHHPGHIENRSFMLAEPYLRAAGIGESSLSDLKVMLLATDVSPLDDPGNYMNQMKAAYRFHFLGERKGLQSLNLDGDLSELQKNPGLVMMCLIMHEADISTSAGLSYEVTKYETAIYGREIGEGSARPSHVIEFLDTVCQQRMISDAAQKLYAANMARIYALAEEDVKEGDQSFPVPEFADFIVRTPAEGLPRTIN